jgi:4a-hydroxytetrahydrobiopterin dehydratase
METIPESELLDRVRQLTGWTLAKGKLTRDFEFPDFIHAFGFMATSALAIEKMNHHPEWSNVYNRVSVALTTHDAGGITEKDLDLAQALSRIAAKLT